MREKTAWILKHLSECQTQYRIHTWLRIKHDIQNLKLESTKEFNIPILNDNPQLYQYLTLYYLRIGE